MSRYIFLPLLIVLLAMSSVQAQNDDIYYDPTRDARTNTNSNSGRATTAREYDDNASTTQRSGDNQQDSQYYEYDDDYDRRRTLRLPNRGRKNLFATLRPASARL